MSKYLKAIVKEPEFPETTAGIGIARQIAEAFLKSDKTIMQVTRPKEYADVKTLARALGATLHGKQPLDKEKKIQVRIAKDGNVYLKRL